MAKSIKLGSGTYLDASGVVVDSNGTTLNIQTIGIPTVTRTSGTATCTASNARRFGNVVVLNLTFYNTEAVPVGGNAFAGTVSGIPLPIVLTTASGYSSSSLLCISLEPNGTMRTRVIGSPLNGNVGITIMYLTA